MGTARRPFALACMLLLTACAGTNSEPTRATGLPAGISNHFAGLMTFDDPAAFRAAAAERGFVTTAEGVVLDIQTRGLKAGDRAALDLPGLTVRRFRPEHERVSAVATGPAAVRSVAALSFVRMVAPAFGATTGGTNGAY